MTDRGRGGTGVVTTGRRATPDDIRRAERLAAAYGLPYVPRGAASIDRLAAESGAVLVVGGDGVVLYMRGHTFRYHPGMGVSRIRMLRQGRQDWMVEAMGLRPGDHLLDATLGIGSDLLVGSFVVGEGGRAVGLESEPLLALVVREGMASYVHPVHAVTEALRRIEVVAMPYQRYLEACPPGSFDVVYFDPLFDEPVPESRHMEPLRALANPEPLSRASLEAARRAARRRVVVKDRRDGPYVRSGWFHRVVGGPRSRIAFCILEVGGGDGRGGGEAR